MKSAMNHDTQRPASRHIAKVITAALMLAAGSVSARPPSVQSAATSAASNAYEACLANELAKPSTSDASKACTDQEAALSAAVLKENPDRPLFAQSYVETLKATATERWTAKAPMPVTVAQHSRP